MRSVVRSCGAGPGFPHKYWVRPGYGRTFSVNQIRTLKQLPVEEQFLAALLSEDRGLAIHLLERFSGDGSAKRFLSVPGADRLSALIYEKIFDLSIQQMLEGVKLDGDERLLDVLSFRSRFEYLRFQKTDDLLVELFDLLKEIFPAPIWIKGPVLARSLYGKPQFRFSVDIDLLLQPGTAADVFNALKSSGFEPIWNVRANECYQLCGIAPVGSVESVMIKPSTAFEDFHYLIFEKVGWPFVELKSDHLNRGLRAVEQQRFFSGCKPMLWRGRHFLVPDLLDHLILALVHFHKHGFVGWHWLYDLHLLVSEVDKQPERWVEFVRRCKAEQATVSCWAGLHIARERLQSPVPDSVILELAPASSSPLAVQLTYSINPEFQWNVMSFPMLILNAIFLGDMNRKIAVLRECIVPSREFLDRYYEPVLHASKIPHSLLIVLHWLMLLLPGGVARRLFGRSFAPEGLREGCRYTGTNGSACSASNKDSS